MLRQQLTISRAERTSTFEKGSSSSRILGSCRIARASDILCRIPCEYCPTGRAQFGIEPDCRNALPRSAVFCNPVEPREVAQILHPAHLVIQQGRMRHVAEFAASLARIAFPKIDTVPRVGCASPARMRSSVVFPAPLSPRMRVEAARHRMRR